MATLEAARSGDEKAFGELVAPHRRELTALCYRMAGSIHDAEDLVQEAMIRAWRGLATFEGRSSLRTWLYRITTNVCLNALEARKARLMPMDLGPAGDVSTPMEPRLEPIWIEPCPADLVDVEVTPEARYSMRESVALAFLTALQLLPPKQRALLLLHDVLGWSAAECAEQLELSIASVNSALQRARDTLDGRRPRSRAASDQLQPLVERYIRAWETSDLQALVSLLHEEATLAMPPIPVWLRGAAALEASMAAMVFAAAPSGAFQIRQTSANGEPALAVYRRDDATRTMRPFALQLVTPTLDGDRIESIVAFLDPSLFARLGLPDTI